MDNSTSGKPGGLAIGQRTSRIAFPLVSPTRTGPPAWPNQAVAARRTGHQNLNVMAYGEPFPTSGGGLEPGQIADALGSVAALGAAALVLTDPSKRRDQMTQAVGGDEMESVKNYFNTVGFDRWKKIYGETDDVNKVQMDIRKGHAQTVEKVLNWVGEDLNGKTFCDAGCGTGSLDVPLALRGATVYASDISQAMVGEAENRYKDAISNGGKPPKVAPVFEAKDLESITGTYQTVTCLDVMIHYPTDKVNTMISHLSALAEERLIVSFAPKTLAYSVLKRIGELFPGPSKATRAYLHSEEDVVAALAKAGWELTRRDMTATNFYFSRLLEAKRTR